MILCSFAMSLASHSKYALSSAVGGGLIRRLRALQCLWFVLVGVVFLSNCSYADMCDTNSGWCAAQQISSSHVGFVSDSTSVAVAVVFSIVFLLACVSGFLRSLWHRVPCRVNAHRRTQ